MKQEPLEDTCTSADHIKAVIDRYTQAEEAAFAIATVADHCRAMLSFTQKLGLMTQPRTREREGTDTGEHLSRHQHADQLQEEILNSATKLNEILERQRTALQSAGGMDRISQLHDESHQVAKELGTVLTINHEQRAGKPCIRGMRISVYDVLEYLNADMSEEEILADFPELTREDIHICRMFATTLGTRLEQLDNR
jgi:uncharacterized protein (DUF433 family)